MAKVSHERDLWRAVLLQAIEDAMHGASFTSGNTNKEQLIRDTYTTRAWLTKANPDLAEVCHLAGFDPAFIMRKMRERLADAPSPEELVSRRKPSKPVATLTYQGETLTIAEWSSRTGLPNPTIRNRINAGWPIERVLATGDLRTKTKPKTPEAEAA